LLAGHEKIIVIAVVVHVYEKGSVDQAAVNFQVDIMGSCTAVLS
jgi:hypothetical protein